MSESKLTSVLPNNSIKGSMPRKPMSTVYVENSNNDSSLEDIMYTNDLTLGFTSLNFGSQNLFRFSRNYQFLAQTVMEVQIANPAVILSDYFAYSAIDQIRWTVGGTELLSIDGKTALYIALEQCETLEKKEALLNAAGRRYVATTGAANHDIQTNTAIVDASGEVRYYAIIPCPWSSLSCMNKIKPIPLHMLNEPIELQIVFKQGADFCTGITAFSAANLHFRYGKLGNPEQLKNQIYRYPFHSHFSHEYTVASGATSVDLQGFRKGEVEQLMFAFVPNNSIGVNSDGIDSVTNKRFFDGIEVDNLKLLFNGQVIWQMPNKEHRIWNLIDGIGAECRHNKRKWAIAASADNVPVVGLENGGHIVVDGVETIGTGVPAAAALTQNENNQGRYVYYRIPIAEIIAEQQKQGHFLGADFTKQSLQLQFDAPKSRNAAIIAAKANVATKLYMLYTYRAMYQFDGDSALLVY